MILKEVESDSSGKFRLSGTARDEVSKMYGGISCVERNGSNWILPRVYGKVSQNFDDFRSRPDDTYIVTFPRSGTTWTQELLWLVANDLNFTKAKSFPLLQRFPFLELNVIREASHLRECIDEFSNGTAEILVDEENGEKAWIEYLDSLTSPRFLKTHQAFLLPRLARENCKVVYVARNPKDVVVSYYHYHLTANLFECNMNISQFAEYFMADLTMYSPYIDHVKIAWDHREKPNVLFLFYEDLKRDLLGCARRVCRFYDKSYDELDMERLVDHLEFRNFQNNPMVNQPKPGNADKRMVNFRSYIRQGKVGSWKQEFPPKLVTRFDDWLERKLKDTDLTFPK